MFGRRDVTAEPVVPVAAKKSRLPIVAAVMASIAAVLLVVAVARRGRTAEPVSAGSGSASEKVERPDPDSPVDPAVVAMFVAVCRYEVGCGVGSLVTCDQIEKTMQQMPRKLAYKSCDTLDQNLAKQCVAALSVRNPSCRDFAKSLALTDLQHALDAVAPCRRACEP